MRVTDSLANIAQPVVSPDGGAVIFTDTHLDGVDLYVAALPALPVPKADAHSPLRLLGPRDVAPPDRPDSWDQARLNDVVVETYDPTWSLLPKSWSGNFAVGPEGPAFNVNLNGADAASLLSWQLAVAYNAAFLHPAASASVRLGNLTLPVSLSADVRPVVTARGRENDGLPELQVDTQIRGTASVTVPFRRRRFSHNLTFGGQRSVSIDQTGVTSAPDSLRPRYPSSVTAPVTTAFTLDWSYSGTEQYRDSVSTERGLTSFTRLRLADRTAFSDVDIREFVTDIRAFQPVPGLGNHVVGVYLSGGAAFDDRAGNSFFSGGFVGRDVLSDALGGDRSGAGVLRGFPLGHVSGSALAAGSLEYRFPLLEIEKGIETLPAYLERIHGAVFVDSAAGFDERASRMDFATGIGAELRVHLILGYYGLFVLRLGYARGLTFGGGDQPYAVLGFPY